MTTCFSGPINQFLESHHATFFAHGVASYRVLLARAGVALPQDHVWNLPEPLLEPEAGICTRKDRIHCRLQEVHTVFGAAHR